MLSQSAQKYRKENFHLPKVVEVYTAFLLRKNSNRLKGIHLDTTWRPKVFLMPRKNTPSVVSPIGVTGCNQSQKHRDCQNMPSSLQESYRGSEGSCWLWSIPQAGNPALYPRLISLDCKTHAMLLSELRAFQKEGKGAGRGALKGKKKKL